MRAGSLTTFLVSSTLVFTLVQAMGDSTSGARLQYDPTTGAVILDWDALPEHYYFLEQSSDLTEGFATSKLFKDLDEDGLLSTGLNTNASAAFFRFNYTDDQGDAMLRADDDGDGIINLLEADAGMDAFEAEVFLDSDGDTIPDYWEQFHFDTLDHDEDYIAMSGGLSASEAYANATDPNQVDSDGDGFSDLFELDQGQNPNYNESRDNTSKDFDNDGLTDAMEILRGTDPTLPDTDSDGKEDLFDAVGYDSYFSFDAVDETPFSVIDLGADDDLSTLLVNDLGTTVSITADRKKFSIQELGKANSDKTEGEFRSINNHNELVYRTIDTEDTFENYKLMVGKFDSEVEQEKFRESSFDNSGTHNCPADPAEKYFDFAQMESYINTAVKTDEGDLWVDVYLVVTRYKGTAVYTNFECSELQQDPSAEDEIFTELAYYPGGVTHYSLDAEVIYKNGASYQDSTYIVLEGV
ncbi:MAG: hypothetical protein AAF546_00430 [Verrucomicrobiota bacterium]